jgi:anti-sigma factor RsiW
LSTTCGEIAEEELVAYWAGDLAPADVDRLDEHLMGCAICSAASARMSEVTEAVRALISPFADHPTLDALRAKGHRIRENPIQPDERRVVVFRADTDLLVHKLAGLDLTTAASVGIVIAVEETGDVLLAEPNVPFDRDSGEVLIVCQPHFAALPPNVVAEVRAREATGSEKVVRYAIPHVYEPRARP